jgi:hypothetical protein
MMSKRFKWSLIAGLAAVAVSTSAFAQITGELVNPNVMMVIDSSGSMDWLQGHPPSAGASWAEARAACQSQDPNLRTSWQKLVDVMLGSIPADEYHCQTEEPPVRPGISDDTVQSDVLDNIAEFRDSPRSHYRAVPCAAEDWNADYQQCIGNVLDPADGTTHGDIWCLDDEWDPVNSICYNMHPLAKARRTNGILDRYSSLVRFGVMTYDNKPAPAAPGIEALPDPHEGLWDYGVSRTWRCKEWYYGEQAGDLSAYPACTWNAGARTNSPNAVGKLVPISDDMAASNMAVRNVLDTTEPLYCSPMGALLDDVGYYFYNHPDVLPSGEGGNDRYFWCRPKLVIFISDGQPTPAFEFPQDYCDENSEAPPSPKDPISPNTIYRCPWNSSNTEASELFSLVDPADADPVLLVVIGFNVPDVDCELNPDDCVQTSVLGDLAQPREFLDQLAFTGWPDVPNVEPPPWRAPYPDNFTVGDDPDDNCSTAVCGSGGALFVESPEQLSAVLDMVLGALTTTTVTRTEVATTDQTAGALNLSSFSDKTVAQYEFNSGYLTAAGLPWKGMLYREGYACQSESSEGGPSGDPDPFHEWLNSQTTRHLYTIPTGKTDLGNTIPKAADYPASIKDAPEGMDILVGLEDTGALTDCDFGGPLIPEPNPDPYQLCSASNAIQAEVVKHMFGNSGSERQFHKLADIYNSTPSILGPPMERLLVQSYQEYKSLELPGEPDKRMIERPPYLFTGTNDGVIHSINVWASGPGDDVEMWGYVPTPLLETIKDQFPISWTMNKDGGNNYISYTVESTGQYQHIFGVDGTPVVADVRLYRNAAGMPLQDEARLWRSIVMGNLGKGGRGYYCLDVTNPSQKPNFRWEISPDSSANNPPGPPDNPEDPTADANNPQTFDDMGIPIAKPALAYAFYEEAIPGENAQPTETEVAVAIIPGGYWNDENNGPEKSTGVYLVRVADGHLIRYLDPTVADDICRDPQAPAVPIHDPMVAQLVGEPAVPQRSRSTLIAKEAYLGDDRGRLWRVDLSGTDPEQDWCIEMYFDTLLTTHFPYKDCIPGECDLTASEYANDSCYAVDCCTGIPGYCQDPDYPFPRIPIVNAPTITQDRDRNNIIIFGTGQIDGLETLDHHRVFSITDRIIFDVTGQRTYHDEPEINWWIGEEMPITAQTTDGGVEVEEQEQEMVDSHVWFVDDGSPDYDFYNIGEKMCGRAVVFAETAYFTTFIPTDPEADNACESGGSRIWGVHYSQRGGDNGAWEENIEDNDFGHFSGGGGGDGGSDSGDDSGNSTFMEYPSELISAVKVVRRPACTGEPTFELVAQRVNRTPGSNEPPPEGQPEIESVKVPILGSSIGFTTVAIDSWSLVFD